MVEWDLVHSPSIKNYSNLHVLCEDLFGFPQVPEMLVEQS